MKTTNSVSNGTTRVRPPLPPDGGRPREDSLDKRQLLAALKQFRRGNFSVRLPDHLSGIDGRIADAFNEVVELNERMADELDAAARSWSATQGQIGAARLARRRHRRLGGVDRLGQRA